MSLPTSTNRGYPRLRPGGVHCRYPYRRASQRFWPGALLVLDRIDEINPPGVSINPADNGWTQPSLEPTQRHR